MGQLTRNAVSYKCGCAQFWSGYSMSSGSVGPDVIKAWQNMLNSMLPYMPSFRDGNGNCTSITTYIGGRLVVDGVWGGKTAVANAGWYYSEKGWTHSQCVGDTLSGMKSIGDSVYYLQRGLNAAIFGY